MHVEKSSKKMTSVNYTENKGIDVYLQYAMYTNPFNSRKEKLKGKGVRVEGRDQAKTTDKQQRKGGEENG